MLRIKCSRDLVQLIKHTFRWNIWLRFGLFLGSFLGFIFRAKSAPVLVRVAFPGKYERGFDEAWAGVGLRVYQRFGCDSSQGRTEFWTFWREWRVNTASSHFPWTRWWSWRGMTMSMGLIVSCTTGNDLVRHSFEWHLRKAWYVSIYGGAIITGTRRRETRVVTTRW